MSDLVKFSMQGSLFELSRNFIDSQEDSFLLKIIINTSNNVQMASPEIYFIDVDALSFCTIYLMLKGELNYDLASLQFIMQKNSEWELLKKTADYLGVVNLFFI